MNSKVIDVVDTISNLQYSMVRLQSDLNNYSNQMSELDKRQHHQLIKDIKKQINELVRKHKY